MAKVDKPKRSFIKKALLAAGAVFALSGTRKAGAQRRSPEENDEILYRETEAFRAYYESLRR
ncbi:MAG: hypothetical protein GXO20_01080 [Thermodesulfobacteria bacterium]|nr:hypothetical protein [Thermodesulfobacteriota bacterium]